MFVLWRQFEFWSRKNSGDRRQRIYVCETKNGHLTSEKEVKLQTWLKRRKNSDTIRRHVWEEDRSYSWLAFCMWVKSHGMTATSMDITKFLKMNTNVYGQQRGDKQYPVPSPEMRAVWLTSLCRRVRRWRQSAGSQCFRFQGQAVKYWFFLIWTIAVGVANTVSINTESHNQLRVTTHSLVNSLVCTATSFDPKLGSS